MTSHRNGRYNTNLLKRDLDARGWTNSRLADEAGVSPATITNFLRGTVQSRKAALAIARALGYRSPRRYVQGA